MLDLASAVHEVKGTKLSVDDMHMIADINRIRMNQEWMSDLLRKAAQDPPRENHPADRSHGGK